MVQIDHTHDMRKKDRTHDMVQKNHTRLGAEKSNTIQCRKTTRYGTEKSHIMMWFKKASVQHNS